MNIKQSIIERRSIRRFKDEKPSLDLIKDILDTARWAPSHCNTQAVRFIIITNPELKQKIVDMGGSIIILTAPIAILVLYPNHSDNIEYKDYIQSAAAVVQNVCLYAHSKNLGSCWINHLPLKKDLQRLFKLPQKLEPIALITMGYSINKAYQVPRKYNINEITEINKANLTNYTEKSLRIKTSCRTIYYLLPTCIKKLVNPFIDKYFVKKFKN